MLLADKHAEALSHYRAVLALAPHSAHVWFNVGVCLQHMQSPDKVIGPAFSTAIRLMPSFDSAYTHLGVLDRNHGARHFARAVQANSRCTASYANSGILRNLTTALRYSVTSLADICSVFGVVSASTLAGGASFNLVSMYLSMSIMIFPSSCRHV